MVGDVVGFASEGAWITGYSRVAGQVDSQFSLQDFPFDIQSIALEFESKSYDESMVRFVTVPSLNGAAIPTSLTLDGWTKLGVSSAVVSNYYPSFTLTFSRMIISIKLGRKSNYYISKYFLVVTMIFMIAVSSRVISHRRVTMAIFFGIVSTVIA